MASTIRGDDGFDSAQYVNLLNTYTGKNAIINGCFRVWQRGTTQSTVGYGSDDRWYNTVTDGSIVNSKLDFAVGQTEVPGNPVSAAQVVVVGGTLVTDLVAKLQKTEDVTRFAGRTVTFSFYAKASSSALNLSVEFKQNFGVGGSTGVDVIGVTKFSLGTTYARYTVTVTLPSISGKVIGTGNNLQATFYFSAGSDYDLRTDYLGHQTGTFYLSNVQLEIGEEATPFEERNLSHEVALCLQYYQVFTFSRVLGITYNASYGALQAVTFPIRMRAIPTIDVTVFTPVGATGTPVALVNNYASVYKCEFLYTWTGATVGSGFVANLTFSAEAEL